MPIYTLETLQAMTMTALKNIAREWQIKGFSKWKTATKAHHIATIYNNPNNQTDGQAHHVVRPVSSPHRVNSAQVVFTRQELDGIRTLKQLKEIAKSKDIVGVSKYTVATKDRLIDLILNAHSNQPIRAHSPIRVQPLDGAQPPVASHSPIRAQSPVQNKGGVPMVNITDKEKVIALEKVLAKTRSKLARAMEVIASLRKEIANGNALESVNDIQALQLEVKECRRVLASKEKELDRIKKRLSEVSREAIDLTNELARATLKKTHFDEEQRLFKERRDRALMNMDTRLEIPNGNRDAESETGSQEEEFKYEETQLSSPIEDEISTEQDFLVVSDDIEPTLRSNTQSPRVVNRFTLRLTSENSMREIAERNADISSYIQNAPQRYRESMQTREGIATMDQENVEQVLAQIEKGKKTKEFPEGSFQNILQQLPQIEHNVQKCLGLM